MDGVSLLNETCLLNVVFDASYMFYTAVVQDYYQNTGNISSIYFNLWRVILSYVIYVQVIHLMKA